MARCLNSEALASPSGFEACVLEPVIHTDVNLLLQGSQASCSSVKM